jgi:hypothetical protein
MSPVEVDALSLSCPDPLELKAFHEGQLPLAVLDKIGQHISVCTSCGSILQDLDSRPSADPIYARLRQCFQPRPLLEEEGFAQLNRAARDLDGATRPWTGPVKGEQRPAPVQLPPIPREIGAYQLLAKIGQGGMGAVFRALQKPVNREVALKMILAGPLAGRDAIARFYREGQAIARLKHVNVVQIFEFGEYAGLPFFTMELIDGGSLAAKLATGPLPWRQAARLVADLAQAIAFAHQQQVVHRDLKPGNILLTKQGIPKISDFGLAKLGDADDNQTRTAAVLGTPAYMAPEQAAGRADAVGPAVDIYALGVILYECLTGRPPFRGETRQQTIDLVRTTEPLRPSRLCHELPADLEAICLKCLEKAPKNRYAGSQALADDLERLLRGESTHVRPANWAKRSWGRLRRHRVAVVAAITLVAVLGAVYWFHPQRALEAIERDLEPGKRTVLIDRTGEPRWSRCIHGKAKTKFLVDADGNFVINSPSLCLLELLPDPRYDHYILRAKVKHQMAYKNIGEAGFYVGHRAFPGVEGDYHLFLQMSFNDVWSAAQSSPFANKLPPEHAISNFVRWCPHLCGGYQDGSDRMLDSLIGGGAGPRFIPTGPNPGWHTLQITVTPTMVQGSWDGKPASDFPVADMNERISASLKKDRQISGADPLLGAVVGEFVPRGGLGLYVNLGSAAFCEVSITPLGGSEALSPHRVGKDQGK